MEGERGKVYDVGMGKWVRGRNVRKGKEEGEYGMLEEYGRLMIGEGGKGRMERMFEVEGDVYGFDWRRIEVCV